MRVKELMRETMSRVKVDEIVGKEYWTAGRVKQGCPLSPMFNINCWRIWRIKLQKGMERNKIR